MSSSSSSKPSFGRRVIAFLVLVLAAWFLLKLIIGSLASVLWIAVMVGLIAAIVWAWRTL